MYWTYDQDDSGVISNVRRILAKDLRGIMAPFAQNVLYPEDKFATIEQAQGWPFGAMVTPYGLAADSLDGAGRLVALLREACAGELDPYKPHPEEYPSLDYGEEVQIEYA